MQHHPLIARTLLYCWASPWTLLGLCFGLLGLVTGGRTFCINGTLEFYGGVLPQLLRRVPIEGGAAAITLGHTVLGRTLEELDRCRDHEQIHVRQYERWGPLFVPAYFWFSLRAWLRGQDPYLDNPFEKEAYDGSHTRF